MNRSSVRERLKGAEMVPRGGAPLHQVAAQFSSDTKWLFVCCGNCVQVFGYSSHQVVCTLRHEAQVTAAILNPRNHLQLMTTTLDGNLTLWDYMDATSLRRMQFEVPLHRLAVRPGVEEPLLFFAVEREEVLVMGLSSEVITDRNPATPPCDQLKDSLPLANTSKPKDIAFTYTGAHMVTASGNGKKLIIYDFDAEQQFRYKSRYGITAIACHPSQLCVATGNSRGEITLWYDFAKRGCNEVVTTLHWHAHAVRGLCFNSDGTYLLSGGEESVLVIWQLKTKHKDFRPRLGSPITGVACSANDSCFAVSVQNNVIRLVSGLNSDVEGTLGGLRRAFVTTPGGDGVRTGLRLHPLSKALVLNSTPGLLQFFDTETQALSSELDVVGLNYVSRVADEPLIPTLVDHVAFSPSADWMVTVESRDNGKTCPELRMKFWKFVAEHQRYVQNTCVDPPHDKAVTSLTFQPSHAPQRGQASTSGPTPSVPMAVTSGMDNRFKTWVLVDAEEGERRGKKVCSWACRSVGYYHKLCPVDTAFSQDGSLLAVNFTKTVTVWDPYLCELRQTFSTPYRDETFKQLQFGHHSCSQYLLASATEHLHVWDLLSCKLLWRVGASVSYLVTDPFTHLAAAFVNTEKASLLYILEPSHATPLSVHTLPSEQAGVVGAAFVPQTWDSKRRSQLAVDERSTLHFITRDQILYSLDMAVAAADSPDEKPSSTPQTTQAQAENPSHKSFLEIFGQRKRPNGLYTTRDPSSHLPLSLSLLDAPPHALPPPTTLSSQFMKRLLPPSPALPHSNNTDTSNGHSSRRQSGGDEEASEEEEEEDGAAAEGVKRWRDSAHIPNCVDKERWNTEPTQLRAGSYKWLTEYFKSTDST